MVADSAPVDHLINRVHSNPGEDYPGPPPLDTQFADPAVLAKHDYSGQVVGDGYPDRRGVGTGGESALGSLGIIGHAVKPGLVSVAFSKINCQPIKWLKSHFNITVFLIRNEPHS